MPAIAGDAAASSTSGRRTQQVVIAERAQEIAAVRSYWSHREEHLLQDKEENIRGAINTVALHGVLHSPMALQETERQRVRRRQKEALANHQRSVASLNADDDGGSAGGRSKKKFHGGRLQQQVGGDAIAAAQHTASTNNAVSSTAPSHASPRQQPCTPRPVSAPIARPVTDRIPPALFAPQNVLLGTGRGGGGRASYAAVSQLSPRVAQLAQQQQAPDVPSPRPTRCNGVARPSSALDNANVPIFSSFSRDGVYRSHFQDGGVSVLRSSFLATQQRRSAKQRTIAATERDASLGALSLLEQQFVDGSAASRRLFYAASCSPSPAASCCTPFVRTCGTGSVLAQQAAPPLERGHGAADAALASTVGSTATPLMFASTSPRLAATMRSSCRSAGISASAARLNVPYAPTPPPCSLHRHSVDAAGRVGVYVQGVHQPPHALQFRSPAGGPGSEGLRRRRSSINGQALGRRSPHAELDCDCMQTADTMPMSSDDHDGDDEDADTLLGTTKSTTASVVFRRGMGITNDAALGGGKRTINTATCVNEGTSCEGGESETGTVADSTSDDDDEDLTDHVDGQVDSVTDVGGISAGHTGPAPSVRPPLESNAQYALRRRVGNEPGSSAVVRRRSPPEGGLQRTVSSLADAFQVAFTAAK